MSKQTGWWVTYATPSQTTMVHQSMLNELPPPGYEQGVVLLPVVHPESAQIAPTPWLVEGWLRLGGTAMVSGRYKSLKSFTARQLALSVAAHVSFLGKHSVYEAVRGSGVVLVCAEESYSEVVHTLWRSAMGLALSQEEFEALPLKVLPAVGRDLFTKVSAGGVTPTANFHALRKACESMAPTPALIVLDTLIALKGNAAENLSDDMRPVFTWFRQLGQRLDATVLIVDHEGYDEPTATGGRRATRRPRGSSDKVGAVDDFISLEKKREDGAEFVLDARLLHRAAGSGQRTIVITFDDPDGPIRFRDPTAAGEYSLGEMDCRYVLAVADGKATSKRQLQLLLGLRSPEQFKMVAERCKHLVEWIDHGKGNAALPQLSRAGLQAAEVLKRSSAQDDGKRAPAS